MLISIVKNYQAKILSMWRTGNIVSINFQDGIKLSQSCKSVDEAKAIYEDILRNL